METLKSILEMGGYAFYVWTAYGAAALGSVGVLVLSWRGWKAREQEFAALRGARSSTPVRGIDSDNRLAKEVS